MKSRVWILLALAAGALLLSRAPVFREPAHHHGDVDQSFALVVRQQYPGWTGVRQCVTSPQPDHDVCWAEVHKGSLYRVAEIGMDLRTATPVPSGSTPHNPWERKTYRLRKPTGEVVANTLSYDWDYLVRVLDPSKLPSDVLVVNGSSVGLAPLLFRFHCSGTAAKITCLNAPGDEITYLPRV
jgi:hypothetical protein